MKIVVIKSEPGEHDALLHRSRATGQACTGDQPPALDEDDEQILDRAWSRLGATEALVEEQTDDRAHGESGDAAGT